MAFSSDQNARLQSVIDAFPDCFFAEDLGVTASKLADKFRRGNPSDSLLDAACADLEQTGQRLQDLGGDAASTAAHLGINGLYCKGSTGREDFLRSYAACFRRADDLIPGGFTDSATWVKAISDTFTTVGHGIGAAAGGIVNDALVPLVKALIVPILIGAAGYLLFLRYTTK